MPEIIKRPEDSPKHESGNKLRDSLKQLKEKINNRIDDFDINKPNDDQIMGKKLFLTVRQSLYVLIIIRKGLLLNIII